MHTTIYVQEFQWNTTSGTSRRWEDTGKCFREIGCEGVNLVSHVKGRAQTEGV
jgi:hypothetical protein